MSSRKNHTLGDKNKINVEYDGEIKHFHPADNVLNWYKSTDNHQLSQSETNITKVII